MPTNESPRSARAGSTPYETFRGSLVGRTPTGADSTLIVTRQGMGAEGRVWLTHDGAIKTTCVLTDQEVAELRGLLGAATKRRGSSS